MVEDEPDDVPDDAPACCRSAMSRSTSSWSAEIGPDDPVAPAVLPSLSPSASTPDVDDVFAPIPPPWW